MTSSFFSHVGIGPQCAYIYIKIFREHCITHESVNRAFSQASKEFRLVESREDSDEIAQALLETSRILAKE